MKSALCTDRAAELAFEIDVACGRIQAKVRELRLLAKVAVGEGLDEAIAPDPIEDVLAAATRACDDLAAALP